MKQGFRILLVVLAVALMLGAAGWRGDGDCDCDCDECQEIRARNQNGGRPLRVAQDKPHTRASELNRNHEVKGRHKHDE